MSKRYLVVDNPTAFKIVKLGSKDFIPQNHYLIKDVWWQGSFEMQDLNRYNMKLSIYSNQFPLITFHLWKINNSNTFIKHILYYGQQTIKTQNLVKYEFEIYGQPTALGTGDPDSPAFSWSVIR